MNEIVNKGKLSGPTFCSEGLLNSGLGYDFFQGEWW